MPLMKSTAYIKYPRAQCTYLIHSTVRGCHNGNIAHTANMLCWHIDLTFCIYLPKYNQMTSTSQVIVQVVAKCVPETICS